MQKNNEYEIPYMVLCREDVEGVIGKKAFGLTDEQMESIASFMSKGFMQEWSSILEFAVEIALEVENYDKYKQIHADEG
jgi:hypothetical protein